MLNRINFKQSDKVKILKNLENIEKNKNIKLIIKSKSKTYEIEIMNLVDNDIFMRYVVIIKDVTQNYKAIEELKENQETLATRERFATLGGLITGIAHSLKSPIFTLTGELECFINLVEEYKSSCDDPSVSDEDNKEIVKDMREWLNKMREQMEQISDAITAIKSQIVTLNSDEDIYFTIDDLVKYVDILMKNTLKQKLTILNFTIKVPKSMEIKGNFNSLVQVINNLIVNSIDSYEGRTNEIVELVIERENNNLIISVIDNGNGVPKSMKNKIFKEIIYNESKNKNGLSLFVSYSNIKAEFGGEITFESNENGTIFKIILPIQFDRKEK